MPNQIEIKVVTTYDGKGIDASDADLNRLSQSTKTASDEQLKSNSKTQEVLGMTRREYMRTGSEAMFAFETVAGKAGEMNEQILKGTNIAREMGSAFMFGGPVTAAIVGIAGVAGLLVEKLQEGRKGADDVVKSLDEMGKADTVTELAQLAGVTDEHAKAMLEAAKLSPEYRSELRQMAKDAGDAVDPTAKYARSVDDVVKAWSSGITWGQVLAGQIQDIEKAAIVATHAVLGLKEINKNPLGGGSGGSSGVGIDPEALAREGVAITEHNKALDYYKANLHAAASEVDSYRERMQELAETHTKAAAGFTDDWTKAESKAVEDRAKISRDWGEAITKAEADAADNIVTRNQDMLERIGELKSDHLLKDSDAYRTYSRSITDLNDDIKKNAEDNARETRDLNLDALTQEENAKTYKEAMQVRRSFDLKRQDLAAKQTADNADIDKRQARLNDDYRYNAAKDDEALRKAIANEQEQTSKQIAEIRKREAEQIASANRQGIEQMGARNKQLTDEKAAITERKNAENSAYDESKAKATTTHNQRMKELTEYTSAVDQYIKDYKKVATDGINIPVRFYAEMVGSGAGVTYPTWESVYKHRAEGGSLAAGEPAIVGERGVEVFVPNQAGMVIPNGKFAKAGATRGDVHIHINGPVYGVDDLERTIQCALDRHERGY